MLRGWLVDAELQLTAANRAAAMQGMRLPMDVVHPEVFAPWDDDVAAVPGDGVNRKLDLLCECREDGQCEHNGAVPGDGRSGHGHRRRAARVPAHRHLLRDVHQRLRRLLQAQPGHQAQEPLP